MSKLHDGLINLSQSKRDLFPLVSVEDMPYNDNELPISSKNNNKLSNSVKMRIANFEDTTLTREDYDLIKLLQQNKSLSNSDISKIISDSHITSDREQLSYDEFIIKSGSGHHLYKEALARQNVRLAKKILGEKIDIGDNASMSFDDYMPYKEEEKKELSNENDFYDEMFDNMSKHSNPNLNYFNDDDDDNSDDIFTKMYKQTKKEGIRLRDHPDFTKEVNNLLEESTDMDRLNAAIIDGKVTSQQEIMKQLYSVRQNQSGQPSLYNRSLQQLNTLFFNGDLTDLDELEYLSLRQESLELQMREATNWAEWDKDL